jgi:hypothetical protein
MLLIRTEKGLKKGKINNNFILKGIIVFWGKIMIKFDYFEYQGTPTDQNTLNQRMTNLNLGNSFISKTRLGEGILILNIFENACFNHFLRTWLIINKAMINREILTEQEGIFCTENENFDIIYKE